MSPRLIQRSDGQRVLTPTFVPQPDGTYLGRVNVARVGGGPGIDYECSFRRPRKRQALEDARLLTERIATYLLATG